MTAKRTCLKLAAGALLCAVALAAPGPSYGGAVLDEILNPIFVDQTLPMYATVMFTPNRSILLTRDNPIGQGFVAGLDADRLVRVYANVRPEGNWQPGEGVTMTVYDGPEKNNALGSYTVWYDFRGFDFNVAEFLFNIKVFPGRAYYLELTYAGEGDGRAGQVGVMNGSTNYEILGNVIYVRADAPPGGDGVSWETALNSIQAAVDARDTMASGQGYLNGSISDFDLCFQTHVKRPPDRVGNLKKMFDRMDLTRPELADIKQAVDGADYEAAVAKTVKYFEDREVPVRTMEWGIVPHPDPNYDRTEGDLCLENRYYYDLGIGYVGPDLNWRPELSFDANGNSIAESFTLNRFGPRGILTKAYLGTGDEKYAKKLNDLLVDWYLDNPPPEASGIGGAPIDDVWASLNTGIRLGQGFICYQRVRSSPSFTTDCRMAYIMDMANHADTLIWNGAGAGGNWAITQNTSLMAHALNFPEFKRAQAWFDTSEIRIDGVLTNDFLPDGIEMESAPGYQRWMVYNPLVDTHKLLAERNKQTIFSAKLKAMLEVFAEYFMYLTSPDGGTPSFGDWGGDNQRGFLTGDAALYNRSDMLYVGTAGAQGAKPAYTFKLYPYYGTVTMRSHWGDTGEPFDDARWLFFHGVHHGAHGHADLNGVTVYAYGREILTDPGAYIYGSPEHDLLTRAVSHNLMTVDGQDQGGANNYPFENYCGTPVADYVSFRRPSAYSTGDYKRQVLFVRSNGDAAQDYWIVRDTAYGSGTHSLEQRWHFNPTTVTVDGSLTAKTGYAEDGNLAIMQVTPSRLTAEETTINAWRSGSSQPPVQLPTVIYRANTALPAAIDSILFPYDGPTMPSVQTQTLESSADGRNSVFKVTQGSVEDLFILQSAAGSKTVASENVTFNGEALMLRKVNGVVRSLLLINGSQVTVNGEQIVNLPSPQPWHAVSIGPGGQQVYPGSPEQAASAPAGS